MATQRIELPSTFEFTAYATYDDVDGEFSSVTGENASANRRYTLTATPTGRNPLNASWEPGETRTDPLPKRIARFGTVEGGALAFDGSLEITNTIVT